MNKKRIVIIDEDAAAATLMAGLLEPEYECHVCSDFANVMDFVQGNNPDLLILDYDFNGRTGIQLGCAIHALKEFRGLPIVYVCAKASVDDKIHAFEAGASDFIFKPFDKREFFLRIKVKFRREKVKNENYIVLGNCRLDFFSRRVFVKGKEINLTRRQFDILTMLAKKKNQAVTREELIDSICGANQKENLSKRNIDTQISYMKKNLAEFDWAFEAVHGKGYRLIEGKKELAPSAPAEAPSALDR